MHGWLACPGSRITSNVELRYLNAAKPVTWEVLFTLLCMDTDVMDEAVRHRVSLSEDLNWTQVVSWDRNQPHMIHYKADESNLP